MHKIILIFAVLIFGLANLVAQESLQPENGIVSNSFENSYEIALQNVFIKHFDKYPAFRLVAIPSFTPEWAVEIVISNNKARVISLTINKQLWKNQQNLTDTLNIDATIKVQKAEKEIPIELAITIRDYLQDLLANVQNPKQSTMGLDGTTYHFASWKEGSGFRFGQIWSPKENTKTEQLTRISKELFLYASEKNSLEIIVGLLKNKPR